MSRFDQRLEKLEQRANDGGSMRVVFLNYGETEDKAIARTGADSGNTLFVSWVRAAQGRPAEAASA